MSHSFSTTIPHAILSGISIWCLKKLPENLYFGFITYLFYLISGVLGIITYGSPNYGIKIRKIYYKFWNFMTMVGLPLYLIQFYISSGIDMKYAIIHILLPLTNLFKSNIFYFFDSNSLCIVSLFILSLFTINFYGISTVISCVIAEYGIHIFNGEVPPKDLFTYSLCFIQLFSLKALSEAILMNKYQLKTPLQVLYSYFV